MHLVDFTIEIYYDARPYERQITSVSFFTLELRVFNDMLNITQGLYAKQLDQNIQITKILFSTVIICEKKREESWSHFTAKSTASDPSHLWTSIHPLKEHPHAPRDEAL